MNGKQFKMPDTLIHKPTNTLFLSTKKNKAGDRYATQSMAIFPVAECEEWKENFPMLAISMPPEINQVVAHGNHVFTVLNRSRDKETQKARLWHEWDANTRTGQWYWMEECSLVSDRLIEGWVEAIALERVLHKEDSPEYRAMIANVPEPIRDLCIVRSFNKILAKMPIGKEGEWF
jgi:hypothetical protein